MAFPSRSTGILDFLHNTTVNFALDGASALGYGTDTHLRCEFQRQTRFAREQPTRSSHLRENGGEIPKQLQLSIDTIARSGGTPLIVAERNRAMGVMHLKDA